jgi:DNA-binding transcriptional MocR family regulator
MAGPISQGCHEKARDETRFQGTSFSFLQLRPDSEIPLYRQLAAGIDKAIRDGTLAAGQRIPATRVLMEELGVSRNILLSAINGLIQKGLLVSRPRSGVFVAERAAPGPNAPVAPHKEQEKRPREQKRQENTRSELEIPSETPKAPALAIAPAIRPAASPTAGGASLGAVAVAKSDAPATPPQTASSQLEPAPSAAPAIRSFPAPTLNGTSLEAVTKSDTPATPSQIASTQPGPAQVDTVPSHPDPIQAIPIDPVPIHRAAFLPQIPLNQLSAFPTVRPVRPGVGDHREFPLSLWERLRARIVKDLSVSILGPCDPAGYGPLREAIARYLGETRGVQCTPDQVFVTTGLAETIQVVTTALMPPEGLVAMEEPGHLHAKAAFLAAGARLMPLLVDEEESCLRTGAARILPISSLLLRRISFLLVSPRVFRGGSGSSHLRVRPEP